jgi:uncharacterized membrane protein
MNMQINTQMNTPNPSSSILKRWQWLATLSLLGLILLIVLWNGWLTPVQHIPRSIEFLLLLPPLLLFLRGILHKRYDSYVQVTFPALFYFLLGIWYALTPQEVGYGICMTLLGLCLYLGGFFSARTIMQQDKAKTKQ